MQRTLVNRPIRTVLAAVVGIALVALPSWAVSSAARTPAHSVARSVTAATTKTATYTNPIDPTWPNVGKVDNCGDPDVIHSVTGKDHNWYMYCTSDKLNDQDNTVHYIPTFRSSNLVNWKYIGDASLNLPSYSAPDGNMWAPDVHYFNGKYYMYFTDPDVVDASGNPQGSAIGVMTSKTAHGPWTLAPNFVVEPHDAPCCPGSHMWTFDSSVVTDGGQKYIFYGSYYGGVQARKLSADGFTSDPSSQTQITIDNQYEGSSLIKHGGYWYLLNSATNCCNGPLTGYTIFANRSKNVMGPYVDAQGNQALNARSGGSIVVSMNGNKWVGTGGGTIFNDAAGKTWLIYHGVNRSSPYLGSSNETKRSPLLEPIKWVNGWPEANGGNWTSTAKQQGPVAQKGQKEPAAPATFKNQQAGSEVSSLSEDFTTSTTLGSQWLWVRPPTTPSSLYTLDSTGLTFNIQHTDEQPGNSPFPSLITEPAPSGNYIVETKVTTDVPASGCCFNYAQPDLFIYKNDQNYIREAITPLYGTRFIEFGKEVKPKPGYPAYGNTQLGPPGDTTWFRIAKTSSGKTQYYRGYYSLDGTHWIPGGVWTASYGSSAKIGLSAIADQDTSQNFHATFSYLKVYKMKAASKKKK
jgi:arabinan endo-1,5-alpha-L-arabinosidase